MLSYRPSALEPKSALIVVLHGCGQGAEEYASGAGWLTIADRFGCAVLAPQQTMANNPNRCFNWFLPQQASRGEGEVASIAAMIAYMIRTHNLDLARVYVTGLSAGGAMTMAMLATYPELFAGGAIIAGLPYGVAQDMTQAMSAMRRVDPRPAVEPHRMIPANAGSYPRLTVWHGEADHVVSSANAEAIVSQWARAQGLSEKPTRRTVEGSRSRSVWRQEGSDQAVMELNLVRGLGHGVPLSTLGDQGLGKPGPFMLEAGLCSSTEITKFWGLSPVAAPDLTPRSTGEGLNPAAPMKWAPLLDEDGSADARAIGGGLGDRVLASVGPYVSTDIQEAIVKALRSAGLVR